MNIDNYQSLLYMKFSNAKLIKFLLYIIIVSIIISIFTYDYTRFTTYGIITENYLVIDISTNNSDKITNSNFLKIDNVKYNYEIIDISEIKNDGVTMYQSFALKIKQTYKPNEILKVTFYYDNESILKKIIKIVF